MNPFTADGDAILGRGLAFPLRLDGGVVGMNAYEAQVQQSIRLILGTGVGERVMRPDFGGNLDRLAFEPMSPVTLTYLQHQVSETLANFEPRIEVLGVSVSVAPAAPDGELHVDISYRIKRTDSVFNMVFPLYVERGAI
jgi:phage baseplate assembly protein W